MTWWKFYDQIRRWEKAFGVSLLVRAPDLGVKKAPRVPEVFRPGEKVLLEVKHQGWFPDQMIAVGRNRSVTVSPCAKRPGDLVNVRILETKNNIYLAE